MLPPYFIFVLFRLGREGVQALHHTAAGGQEDVVRLLHGAGAPLGPQSGAGTPLHWACGEGRASCVALLEFTRKTGVTCAKTSSNFISSLPTPWALHVAFPVL